MQLGGERGRHNHEPNLRSFLFDWYNAREFYNESNKTDILNLGVRYYYDPNELRLKDRIEHINGKTYEIPLGSASSGLQSVVPLQIMMQYYAGQYFDSYGEKTSLRRWICCSTCCRNSITVATTVW